MGSRQDDGGGFASPFLRTTTLPFQFATGGCCRNVGSQRQFAGIRVQAAVEAINSRGYIAGTPPVHGSLQESVREAKAAPLFVILETHQIVSPDDLDSILSYFGYLPEIGNSKPLSVGFHACQQVNVPEYVWIGGAGRCFSDPNQQQQQLYEIEKFGNIRLYGVQDDGNNNVSTSQTFAQRKPNTGSGALGPPPKIQDIICKLQVSMLTQLTGHTKAISAITSPMGSNNLYSGSKDECVRIWDCRTGKCTDVVKLEGEVGCMINAGSWILVGIPNTVKAWNTQTNAKISLSGPVGQVYALVAGNGMLFAGIQDGNILVWRFNAATNSFEPAASLTGHSLSVVSLVVRANRLYSGSMDKTIRVWDLDTLQCIQTLTEHTSVVTSLLCWKQYVISCSLDQTIKFWDASENGSMKEAYTHQEEHGVLGLCGMVDAQGNPLLLCSCNDNTVRFYDLPSFNERGKIISMEEIPIIHCGPGVLFFTGNGIGELKVWKWSES